MRGFATHRTLCTLQSGVRGLYQGLAATVLKQASNQGLRFMFFNKYKVCLLPLVPSPSPCIAGAGCPWQDTVTADGSKLSPVGALLGGMGAGCFSTLGNNPADVL